MSSQEFWRAALDAAKFFLIGLAVIYGLFFLFLLGLIVWVLSS